MLTQLGYGPECATWRNNFLTGAQEIKGGPEPIAVAASGQSAALTVTQLFDSLAIRIDAPRAWDTNASIRRQFTDLDEICRMELPNGVLIHHLTKREESADLVVTLTRPQLLGMLGGAGHDGVEFDGDPSIIQKIVGFTDDPDPAFPIVTPRRAVEGLAWSPLLRSGRATTDSCWRPPSRWRCRSRVPFVRLPRKSREDR